MNTPVNTFQDILEAMESDPALRTAMRNHILGEELLQLPARFIQLQDQVAGIQMSIDQLKDGQERLETRQERLETRQEKLEQGLAQTNQRLDQLSEEFQKANGKLSNLIGEDYESHVAAYVHRFLRRRRDIHAAVFSTQRDKSSLTILLDEAESRGLIEPEDTDELDNTDLILTADGPTDYLLAEISVTLQQEDIDRAAKRAQLLARITSRTVTPFAIGAREASDLLPKNVQVLLIPERQETAAAT